MFHSPYIALSAGKGNASFACFNVCVLARVMNKMKHTRRDREMMLARTRNVRRRGRVSFSASVVLLVFAYGVLLGLFMGGGLQ